MLPPPESLDAGFRLGLLICFLFGAVCSLPSVWKTFFKEDKNGLPLGGAYLKAGEYGETELNTTWSVFKEPLNSWTSLAYSVFGIAICYVGYVDYYAPPADASNRMTADAGFSMMIGSFCFYLGISSFLFHASHTEIWRKADAGMTSGICIPLAVFAIWDRVRLPGIHSYIMMSLCSFLLFTLTHGYVPYGSSDYLLPGMILVLWTLELVPRFGGVLHDDQYLYWLRCLFAVLGGALLRAIDIKRKDPKVKNILLGVFFTLLALFGFLVGFVDDVTLCALVAGIVTVVNPARGHIFWHIASAYALYIWWYMLRIRPGDPDTPYHSDNVLVNLLLFIALKNGFRRLVMNIPSNYMSPDYQDRVRLMAEHAVFAVWGYYTVVEQPTVFHSWMFNPILCWFKPVFPSSAFMVYYTAKVAAHVEDVLYLWCTGSTFTKHAPLVNGPPGGSATSPTHTLTASLGISGLLPSPALRTPSDSEEDPMRSKSTVPAMSSRAERAEGEHMRSFHHNIAAMMAVVSLFAGKYRVLCLIDVYTCGSLVLPILNLLICKTCILTVPVVHFQLRLRQDRVAGGAVPRHVRRTPRLLQARRAAGLAQSAGAGAAGDHRHVPLLARMVLLHADLDDHLLRVQEHDRRRALHTRRLHVVRRARTRAVPALSAGAAGPERCVDCAYGACAVPSAHG